MDQMRIALTAGILLMSGLASAKDVRFKKQIDPGALQLELRQAGYSVDYINCSGVDCTVHMPDSEKKDPLPVIEKYVFVDPRQAQKQKNDRLLSLYAKWEAGTITSEEKDRLLKAVVGNILGR